MGGPEQFEPHPYQRLQQYLILHFHSINTVKVNLTLNSDSCALLVLCLLLVRNLYALGELSSQQTLLKFWVIQNKCNYLLHVFTYLDSPCFLISM